MNFHSDVILLWIGVFEKMQNTKIILFSGKARHGKDTAAAFLKEELESRGKTVMIYHFADILKMICETSYNWTPGDKGPVGRTILQNVGTAYRENNPNCWLNIAEEIALATDKEYFIVPDCRYKNEADGFSGFEKYVVRIVRPNFDNGLTEEQKNHKSETDMDFYSCNCVILNYEGLNELKEKAALIANAV